MDFEAIMRWTVRFVEGVGVAVLAGIVLIRTFLSWTIELETEGRWPWRQAEGTT